jgi:probable poly-beta-1,6-N-acetyl-D-glucosamine export protein
LNKKYAPEIDGIRTIAILGVVLIHTTTRVLERGGYNLTNQITPLFFNQIVRFSVPLFLLISGFVLELNFKDSTLDFYKKRFSKILIPYLVWSIIYYLFVYKYDKDNFIHTILIGSASYQLYFIPTLCVFYFIFPVIHKLNKYIFNKFIFLILGITEILILYKDYFIKNYQFPDPIRIFVLSFFFFLAGSLAAQNKDFVLNYCKKWKIALGITSLIIGLYVFNEGFKQYYLTWNINGFYSSWRPSTFLYTFSMGAFLFGMLDKINMKTVAGLSFLVFFIHVEIIEIVWQFTSNYVSWGIFYDVFFFLLVSVISFVIAFFVHKIPKLSRILG